MLDESQVALLKEDKEEVTFFEFFTEVKKFIKDLLTNPIEARPSPFLVSIGLRDGILREKLIDRNIIVKSEKIDEPYNEETKGKESRYYISYKVPKKDFKRKMRRFYQSIFA